MLGSRENAPVPGSKMLYDMGQQSLHRLSHMPGEVVDEKSRAPQTSGAVLLVCGLLFQWGACFHAIRPRCRDLYALRQKDFVQVLDDHRSTRPGVDMQRNDARYGQVHWW